MTLPAQPTEAVGLRGFPEGPLPRQDQQPAQRGFQPAPAPPPAMPSAAAVEMPESPVRERGLRAEMRRLRQENENLRSQVAQRTAELRGALHEIDRTRVTLVEQRAMLSQQDVRIENLEEDVLLADRARTNLMARLRQYADELAAARADRDVLEEETQRLYGRLESASTYITRSDEIREVLESERNAIAAERAELADALATTTTELETTRAESGELRAAADRGTELEAEFKTLQAQLAEAREQIEKNPEIERLAAANEDLQKQLAEAARRVDELREDAAGKTKEIAELRGELEAVGGRLAAMRADLESRDDTIAGLEQQLLAASETTAAPETLAENELLRDIIVRQMREQARREQARRLISEEMERLEVGTESLNESLRVLAAPMELSEEEIALFRMDPVAGVDEGVSALQLSIAVSKGDNEEAGAAEADFPIGGEEIESMAEPVRGLVREAHAAYTAGDLQAAGALYQQLAEAEPDNFHVQAQLAAVRLDGGEVHAAEDAVNRALKLRPNDPFAQTIFGMVCYHQERLDEALVALQAAIEVAPDTPMAHNFLGIVLGEQGRFEEAQHHMHKAIEIKPDYAHAHFNLAIIYATQTPPSKDLARQHYITATQLGAEPDSALEELIQ